VKIIITILNLLNQLAGGQHKNKTLSAIKCIHIPTGIKQERSSRDQHKNKREARLAVDKMLDSLISEEQLARENTQRSDMVGSGMRGDKIRTYRFQEDIIIDHTSGKKLNLKQVFRGNMDKLWK
jgi:peptide chain release factor 1